MGADLPVQQTNLDGVRIAETKFSAVDLRAVSEEGVFEGYASLFGQEDLGHDVVLAGAFADSLRRRSARQLKMLYQHDPAVPVGVWQEVREDQRGLYVKGQLTLEVAKAREILSLMRAGALDGLSIGFRAVQGVRDGKTGVRRLEKVDLWEISIVTFPMLPAARISTVKQCLAQGQLPSEREFERWLTREAGFSRSQARTMIRSGFKALTVMRDAAGEETVEASLCKKIRAGASLIRKSNPPRP